MTDILPAAVDVALPPELAPALRARALSLLADVHTTAAPALVAEVHAHAPRCVVCFRPGKLGGHHGVDGRIEWIHRGCHRRLHRSGRHLAVVPGQRLPGTAC